MRAAVLTEGVSSSLPTRRLQPAQSIPVEGHAVVQAPHAVVDHPGLDPAAPRNKAEKKARRKKQQAG